MENNNEDNILIAKFIGMQKTDIGWYDNEELLKLAYTGDNTFDILLFDKSWDWLMSVVIECFSKITDEDDYLRQYEDIADTFFYININSTYKKVTNFIKFYNKVK